MSLCTSRKREAQPLPFALEDRAAADDIIIGDTPKAKRRKKRLEAFEVVLLIRTGLWLS